MADLTGFMPEETGAEQVRVETFFKPNLDLIIAALGARQKRYNTNLDAMAKVKAKVDEVNSLEGFDRNRYYQKQEEYEKEIDKLMSMYEGDLSKASGDLRVLTSKVGKDFGIHGEMTAINERALGYMANKKELDVRLQEGKIEYPQHWRLQQELEATKDIGIGTDPKAYKGWRKITPMDAIDFDKFANEFLKHVTASYKENDYEKTVDPNGFIIWKKEGHEVIKYEDVLRDLNRAYREQAEKTGQLVDDFDYHIYKNRVNMNGEVYVKKYTDLATSTDEELKLLSIDKPNEDQVKQIQTLINKYAENKIQVDGVIGTDDEQYIKLLKPVLEERKKTYIKNADDIKIMNNDQLRNYYYSDYIESELTRKADPYAREKSKHDIKKFMEIRADPVFEFNLRVRQDQLKADYEKSINNTLPLINTTEGLELVSSEEMKDLHKSLTGLENEQKELEDQANIAHKNGDTIKYDELMGKLNIIRSKIQNMNQFMTEIDGKMAEQGLPTNSSLVGEKIDYYLTGFGGGWWMDDHAELVNYHTFHTAFLSGMSPQERKQRFGTDDITKIKNKYIGDQKKMKELNAEIAESYQWDPSDKDNKHVEKREIVKKWILGNLYNNDLHTGFKKIVSGGGMSTINAIDIVDPIKTLAQSISNNTTKYAEKTNSRPFLQSTEIYATSDEKSAIGQLKATVASSLQSNDKGFLDINNNPAYLARTGEKFYIQDGNKYVEYNGSYDLSKVTAGEVGIGQKALFGDMTIVVPLKTPDNKQLFTKSKSGYQTASMHLKPANHASYNGMLQKAAVTNINSIKQAVLKNLSTMGKGTLELNQGETETLFGAYNNDYEIALGTLASTNFLSSLQKQGANLIEKGSARVVRIANGDRLLIHGVPKYDASGNFIGYSNDDVWSIAPNYEYKKVGNDPGKLIPKETQTLVRPSLYTSITGNGVEKVSQFTSLDELSKSLEFTLNNHFPTGK